MKIRILTYHKVINRGSILHSYGLQSNLIKLFPNADIKFIDYMPFSLKAYEALRFFRLKRHGCFSNSKRFISLRKDTNELLYLDKRPILQIVNSLSENDLLVAGSDKIWAITNRFPFPSFPNHYWLNFKTKAKKISYSTSSYGTDYSLIPEYRKEIDYILSGYSLISVRDEFTKQLINREGVYITPDPSFFVPLCDHIDYNRTISSLLNTKNDNDLVAFQIYQRGYERQVKDYILSNRRNNIIVGLTANYASDINMDAALTTLQWANIYRHFKFVLTDSFHGTIFSLRNEVPFISMETKGIRRIFSKKYYFLKSLDLEDLYLNPEEDGTSIIEKQQRVSQTWESDILPKIRNSLEIMESRLNEYNRLIIKLMQDSKQD